MRLDNNRCLLFCRVVLNGFFSLYFSPSRSHTVGKVVRLSFVVRKLGSKKVKELKRPNVLRVCGTTHRLTFKHAKLYNNIINIVISLNYAIFNTFNENRSYVDHINNNRKMLSIIRDLVTG